jgi:hypothetical protein
MQVSPTRLSSSKYCHWRYFMARLVAEEALKDCLLGSLGECPGVASGSTDG